MGKDMNIMAVLERANRARGEGLEIVNGCAGMLYGEDGELVAYPEILELLEGRLSAYLSYAPVLGSQAFGEGAMRWVFGKSLSEVRRRYFPLFAATLGGTGALAMILRHASRKGGEALFPFIGWPNYEILAKEQQIPFSSYRNFNAADRMDFDAVDEAIQRVEKRGRIPLLAINDPCQNPTGYCMDGSDYEQLFSLLKRHPKVELLMDVAYLDYAPRGFLFPDLLVSHPLENRVWVAFSCSKSFGLYGVRLGGLALLDSKGTDGGEEAELRSLASGTYSCPVGSGLGPMAEFFLDPRRVKAVKASLSKQRDKLVARGRKVVSILSAKGFDVLPYEAGFYVSLRHPSAYPFCESLEQRRIYFAPVGEDLIRVAVCGLTEKDIERLKRWL